VDVLAAPEIAVSDNLEPARLHDVIEYSRMLYDWVIIDLPTVFHRLSLFALSEADQCYMVSTIELSSLHLARRAVGLLSQLGFERDRYQMVINRVGKSEGITAADMEKIFNCSVYATLPNDYQALHRVVTRGEPLGAECELGRAMEQFASRVAGINQKHKKAAGQVLQQKPALSEL